MIQIHNPEPINRGTAWNTETFFYKLNGVAIPLNGYTVTLEIEDSNNNVVKTLTSGNGLTVDNTAASIKPVLTDADTTALTAGSYGYRVKLSQGGQTTIILKGTLDLVNE